MRVALTAIYAVNATLTGAGGQPGFLEIGS
jgi:hypothetical protein